jgi:hypothetical protein
VGTPPKLGSHIGESITAMAQELLAADRDPAAEDAVLERHEQRLRERWGGQFDANVAASDALARAAGLVGITGGGRTTPMIDCWISVRCE